MIIVLFSRSGDRPAASGAKRKCVRQPPHAAGLLLMFHSLPTDRRHAENLQAEPPGAWPEAARWRIDHQCITLASSKGSRSILGMQIVENNHELHQLCSSVIYGCSHLPPSQTRVFPFAPEPYQGTVTRYSNHCPHPTGCSHA